MPNAPGYNTTCMGGASRVAVAASKPCFLRTCFFNLVYTREFGAK